MGSNDTDTKQVQSIPIIDLSAFLCGSPAAERPETAKQLVEACRNVGLVYIKNHGIPSMEIEKAFNLSRTIFTLPDVEKLKAPHPPGWAHHRGYSHPGLENVTNLTISNDEKVENAAERELVVQDFKESYEIGSEDNPNEPNIWPPDEVLPEWRPFMTTFYWTCWTTAQLILQAVAIGLEIEEDLILKPHSGHYNQLRLLHYPPIRAGGIESGRFTRIGAHTDWTTITMLFQDDCGGLQVEDPVHPGAFIDAEPMPDTLVLNVGDLLMRWSNDDLISIKHRVQLPPLQDRFEGCERTTRARYSIPYFVTTDPDAVIECLPRKDGRPAGYEPVTQKEYATMRAQPTY